jgi:hypothetical protein
LDSFRFHSIHFLIHFLFSQDIWSKTASKELS